MRLSPKQAEALDLYDAIIYWRRIKWEQEDEVKQKLQYYQLAAMAVRNPEEYAKLLAQVLADGGCE